VAGRWPWRLACIGLGLSAGLGALAALYAVFGERTGVRLDTFTIQVARSGLPPGGLALLHITDLHLRAGGRVQERKLDALRRIVQQTSYDLALVTGDLIHDEAGFPVALDLLAGLRPRLGSFCVPGNHDYCEYTVLGNEVTPGNAGPLTRLAGIARSLWRVAGKIGRNDVLRQPVACHDVSGMLAALQRQGIEPLVNRSIHVQAAGVDLWLAGVDDLVEGRPDLGAALADVSPGPPLILLAHNPDAWLDNRVERADLVLSGHTHGGQVSLPGLGAIHTQGTHLARHKAAGWFRRDASRLFVSRGAGESLPLRLGAPPQVALIRIYPT
jgi:uncharacterized protein